MSKSKPSLLSKADKQTNTYQEHDTQQNKIPIRIMQFWYIIKIHPIQPCKKRKRHKNSGDDGQNLHHLIHFKTDFG